MSRIDLDRGGSLRPQLENLTGEQVQRLTAETLAEARRRAIFLDENNTSAANELYRALEERDASKHAVGREFNVQHAERMAVAWAERAEALLKEKPDAPGVPVDFGRELDQVLEAAAADRRARNAIPSLTSSVLSNAAKLRDRYQWWLDSWDPIRSPFTAQPAYRARADDPDFDTRNDRYEVEEPY